jgi:hypothetical protein
MHSIDEAAIRDVSRVDLFLITGNTKNHPIQYLSLSENVNSITGRSRLSKEKTCSWLTDGLTGYDSRAASNIEQLNSSP